MFTLLKLMHLTAYVLNNYVSSWYLPNEHNYRPAGQSQLQTNRVKDSSMSLPEGYPPFELSSEDYDEQGCRNRVPQVRHHPVVDPALAVSVGQVSPGDVGRKPDVLVPERSGVDFFTAGASHR